MHKDGTTYKIETTGSKEFAVQKSEPIILGMKEEITFTMGEDVVCISLEEAAKLGALLMGLSKNSDFRITGRDLR